MISETEYKLTVDYLKSLLKADNDIKEDVEKNIKVESEYYLGRISGLLTALKALETGFWDIKNI